MPASRGASPVLFTHQVAADATGISAGILKRQAKNGLLGWPSERLELGVPADRLTLHEVIRADAMRHFRAAGGRPSERTRAFLAQHRFDLCPFVLILRPVRIVVGHPARRQVVRVNGSCRACPARRQVWRGSATAVSRAQEESQHEHDSIPPVER